MLFRAPARVMQMRCWLGGPPGHTVYGLYGLLLLRIALVNDYYYLPSTYETYLYL